MEISVVIVNFNAGPALAATLASLPGGLATLTWECVVVDNASCDGSERAAMGGEPGVRLVKQQVNRGFAWGVNAGAAATSGALLLLLNPDCSLQPGAVATLRAEMEGHAGCAVVGPRILNPNGTLQESARGDPNLLTGIFGRTGALSQLVPGTAVVRKNLVSRDAIESGAASALVDWVSGACMLVRRDAFEAVGGFDDRYFLYWEDADFCRRLRNAGWHTRYVPGATVHHHVGQSSRTARRLANREFHRSAYRYYTTHVITSRWHPGRALAWTILRTRSALKQLTS